MPSIASRQYGAFPSAQLPCQPVTKARRWRITLLKFCVAAGSIYWLFAANRLDLGALTNVAFDSALFLCGTLAVCGVLAGLLLQSLRLMLLARISHFPLSFSRALAVTLIGSLAGAVLPGHIAGDAVKAFYLCGDAVGRRGQAIATVVVDRALGLYSLFLLAFVSMSVAWYMGTLPACGTVGWVAPGIALAGMVGLGVTSLPALRRLPLVGIVLSHSPTEVRSTLEALRGILHHPHALAAAITLSLLNHALVVTTYLVASLLLHEHCLWSIHFVFAPLAMATNILPLTPGGIGLAEGAFSYLYESVGSSQGAVIGLLGRLLQYLAFVLSGTPAVVTSRVFDRRADSDCPPYGTFNKYSGKAAPLRSKCTVTAARVP